MVVAIVDVDITAVVGGVVVVGNVVGAQMTLLNLQLSADHLLHSLEKTSYLSVRLLTKIRISLQLLMMMLTDVFNRFFRSVVKFKEPISEFVILMLLC